MIITDDAMNEQRAGGIGGGNGGARGPRPTLSKSTHFAPSTFYPG